MDRVFIGRSISVECLWGDPKQILDGTSDTGFTMLLQFCQRNENVCFSVSGVNIEGRKQEAPFGHLQSQIVAPRASIPGIFEYHTMCPGGLDRLDVVSSQPESFFAGFSKVETFSEYDSMCSCIGKS